MKKTVIFLLAALMLPLCESLHAQRRSDYKTFNSSNVIHTRSVSHEPWAIDRVKVAYFDFFSDIVDNCDAPMHLNTNPGDYGDPDGTLNYYPEAGLYSFTLKECVEVSNNRGVAPGTYQSIYNRLISCSYGFCVKAHGFNQIGKNLFSNIPALEQTEIGSGVRHLLEGTFRDSKNLKYVKFGPNVIKIDQDCFLGCSGLEVVEFENGDVNSVTHIKDDIKHMFHTDFDRSALYCTNMKAFVVPDHLVSEYKTVLNDVFKPVKDGACRVISKTEFYSPYVTGVALNTSSVTLSDTNTTRQLIASVLPSNTWNKKVIWRSDNPSVATVSATGLVTYISPGTATITATTEDGGYTDTCTVTAVYLKSSDATFKYISTSYGELPLDKFTHRLTVPNATGLIYITADSNHPLAVVSGDTDYKTLNVGDNVFTVTITAEDGSTLTHTITVHRRSTDATLKSFTLTCNGGNIPFGFNPAAQNFTVTVASPVTHVVIAADANHSHATVSSGTGYKSLNTGDNTFTVIVTAEDDNLQRQQP